jgi:hypothetical protein
LIAIGRLNSKLGAAALEEHPLYFAPERCGNKLDAGERGEERREAIIDHHALA